MSATDKAEQLGRRAGESDWFDVVVRVGLVAFGVVYLLIGWLALLLALGDQEQASSKGAMQQLARQPYGVVAVWAVALGMFCLVVWRLLEAAVGHRDEDGAKRTWQRVVSATRMVVYAVLGFSAVKVALGAGSSSNGGRSATARLMDLPAGPWIVGLVGVVIVVVGASQVRRGLSEKFREGLSSEGQSGEAAPAYLLLGKVGYTAKGLVIALVGVLFGYAALSHDPKRSGGLDQALHTVLRQPYGPYLLGVIAVGLACFGLFCFARARHLSK